MISVLIRVKYGPEALAVTLGSLVPAVAAGLVGDAVIIADGPDPDIAQVADAAGATLVLADKDVWKSGAKVARKPWLLCLDDGDIPQEGWIRALDRFIMLDKPGRERARMKRQNGNPLGRVRDSIERLTGSSSIRAGDLVHQNVLFEGSKARAPVRLSASIERDPAFG